MGLDPALSQSDPYDIKRSNVVKEIIQIKDSDPDIPACEKPTLIVGEKTWMTDHHIDLGSETLERQESRPFSLLRYASAKLEQFCHRRTNYIGLWQ